MKLFFRKYGSGPYLIILHGLFGSSDNWVTIAKKISDRFTVVLPDQRNHGLSPHSDVHNYDAMATDLSELVEELEIDKFILAGHSMGGKAAMNFALKWPEKLNGLLVADISPFAANENSEKEPGRHLEILNSMLSVDPTRISDRSQAEKLLSDLIPSGKIRGLIMKNLKRNPDNSFSWKINASSLLNNLDNIMGEIIPGMNENIHVTGFPVIFLKGEFSDYLSSDEFTEIKKIFPSADLFEVKGAGHWIHTDKPDIIEETLIKFIGQH